MPVNRSPAPAYHVASDWDYALDRFARCKAIMGRQDFGALLVAVRRKQCRSDMSNNAP